MKLLKGNEDLIPYLIPFTIALLAWCAAAGWVISRV